MVEVWYLNVYYKKKCRIVIFRKSFGNQYLYLEMNITNAGSMCMSPIGWIFLSKVNFPDIKIEWKVTISTVYEQDTSVINTDFRIFTTYTMFSKQTILLVVFLLSVTVNMAPSSRIWYVYIRCVVYT